MPRNQARALRLGTSRITPYALAVTFGDLGRLFIVAPSGTRIGDALQPLGSGGTIRLLPPDRSARQRFYVHTRPDDDNPLGSVGCQELAIWRWDGSRLETMFKSNYPTYKGQSPRYDGHAITFPTKGEIRWLSTSNQDDVFDATHRIVVGRDAIRDEGLHYANPEFALIEELFERAASGRDVRTIASPQAQAVVDAVVSDMTCVEGVEYDPTLGWLGYRDVERGPNRAFVRLEAEDVPGPFQFVIESRPSGPYVVEALHGPPAPVALHESAR
jgi:hypothetical protein